MTVRTLQRIIPSVSSSDGAGVKLRRSLGNSQELRHDPFLMLDEFFSDDPEDYLRGFQPTPTAASKPSPTCSTATCGTRIIWGIAAISVRAMCSG